MEEAIHSVRGANCGALEQVLSHWGRVAKSLSSLDVLEEDIVHITGASRSYHISIDKRAIVVMCADNEIVEEEVTQTGRGVAAIVAGNVGKGCSCTRLMAERAGTKVIPVDAGMSYYGEVPGAVPEEVSMSIESLLGEPATSREQTVMAMEAGMRIAEGLKNRGHNLAGSGEMGIGNTTTSNAVLSVPLDQGPGQVTERGASLTAEGYKRRIRVIKGGIAFHRPDREDPVDVFSKMGGLDLAALVGSYIGCGAVGLPVVIDRLITGAAALAMAGIYPSVKDYLLASHISAEPAGAMVLKAPGLKPAIQARMCLGEGAEAAALLPLLDMAAVVYDRMDSFEEIHVKQYGHLR